ICLDAFAARGRQRAEDHLPTLLDDIREIVDGQRQNEPPLRSKRLYTRLSTTEVRRQLSAQKGYTDDHLPTSQAMTTKLNELGYFPKKVATTKPQNSTN
ncbi:transposase, partial [Candidatus Entotheonella serta]